MRSILFFGRCRFSEGGKRKSLGAVFFSVLRVCLSSVVDRNTWVCSGKRRLELNSPNGTRKYDAKRYLNTFARLFVEGQKRGETYVAKSLSNSALARSENFGKTSRPICALIFVPPPPSVVERSWTRHLSPPPTPTIPRLPHEKDDRPQKLSFQIVKADVSHIC